jgi:transcriptional regulator with XRE-family HTH domain
MEARRFRTIRRELGWSQQRLAIEIGTTTRSISRWEHGEHPIDETVGVLTRLLLKTESTKRVNPVVAAALARDECGECRYFVEPRRRCSAPNLLRVYTRTEWPACREYTPAI